MSMRTQEKIKVGSPLSHYLKEISQISLLNGEEEQALAERIQWFGDEAARQQLMRANLRLVVNMAKRYSPERDPEVLLDLIQEGNIGLMRAVDRFKPERKTRFSTYAVYWIRQAVLRSLKSRRLVRLPENVVDQILRMQRTRQTLYQLLGRQPSHEELAKEMNLPVGEIRRLEEASSDIVSLEQAVRGQHEDDNAQLQELLEDNDAPAPQQVAQKELVRGIVLSAVESLPAREKKIVELRFGLGNSDPHTLEDIGRLFGISRERVRQLQNSALRRLRERQSVAQAHSF